MRAPKVPRQGASGAATDIGLMTTCTSASAIGRIDERRRVILTVAREVFLHEGYAASSMSNIAARVGGSKGTLYNYFRSKEELFAAFMIDACQDCADALFNKMPPFVGDFRENLINLGCDFVAALISDPLVAIHRIVIAESGRFPELGRVFYESGPRAGELRLASYIEAAADAGLLRRCNYIIAARRFKDLCLSDTHSRRMWGVADEISSAGDVRHIVVDGVDIFLQTYGALHEPEARRGVAKSRA